MLAVTTIITSHSCVVSHTILCRSVSKPKTLYPSACFHALTELPLLLSPYCSCSYRSRHGRILHVISLLLDTQKINKEIHYYVKTTLKIQVVLDKVIKSCKQNNEYTFCHTPPANGTLYSFTWFHCEQSLWQGSPICHHQQVL